MTYAAALTAGLVLAVLTAIAGVFVTTPYGRFASRKLGPSVPIRLGWLLMEAPCLTFYVFYLGTSRAFEPVPLLFAAVWTIHYTNRLLVFPLTMRARPDSRMAASVFLSGWVVVPLHAWLYATWFGELGTHLTVDWLTDPRFLVGLPLYALGLFLIVHTEAILRRLRPPGPSEHRYSIPYGGGYRWVSSPHYLGELVAWAGLALASWCPGGLFIFAISLANLVPRALATHAWYKKTFPDYPAERRALVPFLW